MISARVLVPLCVLLMCVVPRCFSYRTCEDTLNVVRNIITDEGYHGETGIQGAVGPPGERGPPGQVGSPGPRGEPGVCSCDCDSITAQLAELQDFMNKARRSPGICYIGISTGVVNPAQLSSSSTHYSCPIKDGILNSAVAWCANINDGNQWIQVDYLVSQKVTGILSQGRGNYDQWVTSYQVSYGNATTEMQYYQELEKVKIFSANSDRNTIVDNELSPPINARYVRIHPVTYHNHMSMRIEMKQC